MVTVRPAVQVDLPAVAGIHSAARSVYYRAGGYEPVPGREWGVAGWRSYLDDPVNRIAVADMTDITDVAHGAESDRVRGAAGGGTARVAGFVCARAVESADPVVELVALYVDPGCWSLGVGSALHTWFVAQVRRSPRRCGVLEVWAGNARALAFYRARGWCETPAYRPGPLQLPYVSLRVTVS